MKVCVDCVIAKPVDEFYSRTTCCKPCHRARSRRYREEHRAELAARSRAQYAADPEPAKRRARKWEATRTRGPQTSPAARARKRRWHEAHREEMLAKARERDRLNPEARRERTRRRRARLRGATVEPVDYKLVLAEHGRVCHICGGTIEGPIDFDHVVPIAAGGEHSHANVRPSHPSCNRRKGARLLDAAAA